MMMMDYETKTTFWDDFAIAEAFGREAVVDTYERAMDEWSGDAVYVTELAMVLNWRMWLWYEKGDEARSRTYDALWRRCDEWCFANLKGEDLEYYCRTTD